MIIALCIIASQYFRFRLERLISITEEEKDYIGFLNDIIARDLISLGNSMEVVGNIGSGKKEITVQIKDNSIDQETADKLHHHVKELFEPFFLDYYCYQIECPNSQNHFRFLLQENSSSYYYKTKLYRLYLRFVLYYLKNGYYPESLDELSTFSFSGHKVRRINTSRYIYCFKMFKIRNDNDIQQLKTKRVVICISGDGEQMLLSDGQIIPFSYYRTERSLRK